MAKKASRKPMQPPKPRAELVEDDVLDTPELTPIHPNEPAEAVAVAEAPAEVKAPAKVFRPSDIPSDVNEEKRFEWLKEGGHPNPKRLYRVTANRGSTNAGPVNVEAVDEPDAINQAIALLDEVKDAVRWNFRCFVLEE